MSQLEEIKARAEKATPGPWEVDANFPFSDDLVGIFDPNQRKYIVKFEDDFGEVETSEADAEFIAHARTDIPKLIAALEAVEKLANNWQKVGKRPDTFDAALHHAAVKLHTAITEALQ